MIYSPSQDGTVASAWNEITANHTDNFEAGKWTLCTATFTPSGKGIHMPDGVKAEVDVTEESYLEFRLGNGIPAEVMEGEIAYMMDDFFVFPEVDNKGDNSKERAPGGGLTTEEIYNANWTFSTGSTSVEWMSEGANGTAGAANITVLKDWGTLRSRNPLDMEFGRTYTLTFWAKATCEEAVGFDMYAYLSYANHKTLEETPKWFITKPAQAPYTLTTEWQKFSIDFQPISVTPEKIYPYLYFRAGEGTETVSYAVDEISIVQKGDSNFDVLATADKTADGENVVLQLNYAGSSSKHFLYKMIQETESGDKVLRTVKTTDKYIVLNEAEYGDLRNIRIETVSVDAFNLCSQKKVCRLREPIPEDNIRLSADQYIWNDDIKDLSATLEFNNETADCDVITYAAQYNAENMLLSVKTEKESVPINTEKSWQTKTTAEPTAVKVKYFAWVDDGTQRPVTTPAELNKTTSGEFIYVDVNSTADTANGSFDAPYKSLNNARNRLRNRISLSEEENIYMIFKGGEYVPGSYSAMDITSRDYAENKHVIYTSLDKNRAKFTGAKHLTGFTIYDTSKNIYRAEVPAGTQTRQLYVNGIKATRARSPEDAVPFVNLDQGEAKDEFLNLGLTSTDTSFLNYQYPNELEIYFTQNWRHQFVMVDTITATEDGLAHFGFTDNQGKWGGIARCNTPAKHPVFVENAYELLDEPGEWYLDTHKNYIYYIPREFEDMSTADVVIPGMEKLLTIKGTADAPAKNMTFQNIDFEYSTWHYPTTNRAFINGQNATYTRSDNGGQLMDAAVELFNAHNITFDNCDFSKIGSMALKMTGAIQHCNVIGNEFYELAGGAVNLGEVNSNDGISVRYPTDPKHYITDNVIANNYIHKIGTEYKSAAAIGAGFPKNTVIRNNDLSDGPYSGMHTGWGWGSTAPSGTENFVIEKNYIHDFMNWRLYDGGGIYTLGNTGGTKDNPNHLRENYFVDIANHYGGIYPDEGSTGWRISDNVVDTHNYPVYYGTENSTADAIWLHIWTTSIMNIWFGKNYSTTSAYKENGKDIEYVPPEVYSDAQWPDEALKIINDAGIEKEYRNRFDFGLQTIRIPRLFEVGVGETQLMVYSGISSKDRLVDLSDYEITAKSSRPDVATADAKNITGHSAGT
ncbi:MAG: carbohydrate binding domain-containing protein, partial [Clostridia bacterium]|nr:carbohydrate binding domain-containing protein [Clostridia bacterium]